VTCGRGRVRAGASPLFIKNYSEAKLALEYDPQTGKWLEIARERVTVPFTKGFYISASRDLVGVFASPTGPVFFVNGERHAMTDLAFGVEHHRGQREHQFTARRGGKLIYELRYRRRTDWATTTAALTRSPRTGSSGSRAPPPTRSSIATSRRSSWLEGGAGRIVPRDRRTHRTTGSTGDVFTSRHVSLELPRTSCAISPGAMPSRTAHITRPSISPRLCAGSTGLAGQLSAHR
jgi:hypothetical protein